MANNGTVSTAEFLLLKLPRHGMQQITFICCIMLPLLHRWEVRIRAEFRTENTTQKTLLRPVLNALKS